MKGRGPIPNPVILIAMVTMLAGLVILAGLQRVSQWGQQKPPTENQPNLTQEVDPQRQVQIKAKFVQVTSGTEELNFDELIQAFSPPTEPLSNGASDKPSKPEPPEKILLPADWNTIEISVGSGSCWGEATSAYLALTKTADGGVVSLAGKDAEKKGPPRKLTTDELRLLTDRLAAYCADFQARGVRTPNYWLLHKVEFRRPGDKAAEILYFGAFMVQDPKAEEFHKWLRSLHPQAGQLAAESHWKRFRGN
jgi:hypothetical protein